MRAQAKSGLALHQHTRWSAMDLGYLGELRDMQQRDRQGAITLLDTDTKPFKTALPIVRQAWW